MPTIKIYASADTYVDQQNPNTNYGSSPNVEVKITADTYFKNGWWKFNLSSLPATASITAASLYSKCYFAYGSNSEDSGYPPQPYCLLKKCSDNSWTESTITWNNAPTATFSLMKRQALATPLEVVNCLEEVRTAFDGDKLLSLRMEIEPDEFGWGDPFMWFGAKEYGATCGAYLEVTYLMAITNVDELQAMNNYKAEHYILANDIDASITETWNGGKGFVPIGAEDIAFYGSLDGQGHKITNLYIDREDESFIGLFGKTGYTTRIQNVGLENLTIVGGWETGGLVGENGGLISNCYSTGVVIGIENQTGGLVGANMRAGIDNCYSTCSVISFSSPSNAGGLVGVNDEGILFNCYSTGPVEGSSYTGGLIGRTYNDGVADNCFWDIETSGQSTSAGGTGKTTAQMKNVRTFTDVGWSEGLTSPWDFVGNPYEDVGTEDIWDIKSIINDGYPFFYAPPPSFHFGRTGRKFERRLYNPVSLDIPILGTPIRMVHAGLDISGVPFAPLIKRVRAVGVAYRNINKQLGISRKRRFTMLEMEMLEI